MCGERAGVGFFIYLLFFLLTNKVCSCFFFFLFFFEAFRQCPISIIENSGSLCYVLGWLLGQGKQLARNNEDIVWQRERKETLYIYRL